MMRNLRLILVCALGTLLIGIQANAQTGVQQSAGGVDAVFTPDAVQPTEGLVTGILSLESAPGTKIVTYDNISFSNVHQVGVPGRNRTDPTAVADDWFDLGTPPEWMANDSYILIRGPGSDESDVGGQVGGGYAGITETNDESDPVGLGDGGLHQLPFWDGIDPAPAGVGDINTPLPTDAFFTVSALQTNNVQFARVAGIAGTTSHVTLGVLGESIENCTVAGDGTRSGACFDFDIDWTGPPAGVEIDFASIGATLNTDTGQYEAQFDRGPYDQDQGGGSVDVGFDIPVNEGGGAGGAAAAGPFVDLVSVTEILNEMGKYSFTGGALPIPIKAGTVYNAPFDFDTSMPGTFSGSFLLDFSNGDQLLANFTATTVPEPGTFSLLGIAGMMVCGLIRRRR